MFKFSFFSGKRAKPRERPQKGLNHVRLYAPLVAASLLYFVFELQERCVDFVCFGFISGPFRRAMAVFKLSLFSGNRAKPRERPQRVWHWNRSGTAGNCSPSQTLCLFGYSVIASELQEECVDCVTWFHYCTSSKHLPAHHLRLHILFLPNWFQVNFWMPVFLWNHAHKNTIPKP